MNEYLARLKAKIQENPLPQEPSKPSKRGFEGFEGGQGRHISGISKQSGAAQAAAANKAVSRRDSPLAMSFALSQAIEHAAHFHIQFWLEDGLLITRPPQDYRREVQAAERALMARTGEIKTLCAWPRRPKGYSDANWLRATAESCRLGYNKWEGE